METFKERIGLLVMTCYYVTIHAQTNKSSNPTRRGQQSLNKKIFSRISTRREFVHKLVIPDIMKYSCELCIN